MTESVGYASLQIIPSFRGFSASMDRQLARELPAVGRRAGEQVGTATSDGFGRTISGMSRHAKLAAVGIGAALGAGGIAAIKWGVGLAAANEQAQISFETMLGSGQKASTFLSDLRDFAAQTPFEFPELQTAASSLISAGIEADKVIPIMTTLGDVTAGMGTGSEGIRRATVALQQMQAAGRITGEDLNQLRDAGIPVYDLLAAATGKAKSEVVALAQAGKLGKAELDQLMSALENGEGLERFSGLMDKQSESLTGLVSTLKDELGQKLATAMEPVNEQLKLMLPSITDVTGAAVDFGAKGLSAAIEAGQDFARWVGPLASDLGDDLLPILEDLAEIAGDVVPDALGLMGGAVEGTVAVLSPFLGLVADATGFLADHNEMVLAAATAYAAWKAAQVGAAVIDAAKLSAATTALQGFVTQAHALAAVTGVSQAQASISLLMSTTVSGAAVAGGALAGLAAGAVLAFQSLERSADHGREAADRFVDSLNIDTTDSDSMFRGMVEINDQIRALSEEANRSNWTQWKQRLNPFDENTIDEAEAEQERLSGVLAEYAKDLQKVYGAAKILGTTDDSVDAWIKKLDLDVDELGPKRIAAAIDDARNAAENGTPATDDLAEAYRVLTDETATSTEKINAWKGALDTALGGKLNLFDAESNFKAGLESFTNTLEANSWGGFGTETEAGRANRDALSEQVRNVQSLANAYADLGNQDKAAETIRYGREQIIKAGTAAGISEEQTRTYLEQLGLTEGTWKAQVQLNGAEGATTAMAALKTKLDEIPGQVTTRIVAVTDEATQRLIDSLSLGATLAANSGTYGETGHLRGGIDNYAAGGLRPSMIGAGRNLVWWDEPATGGEGYFPRFGAGPDRDRNMATVAGWYGGLYVSKADQKKARYGGRTTNAQPRRGDLHVHTHGQTAREVEDSIMWAGR